MTGARPLAPVSMPRAPEPAETKDPRDVRKIDLPLSALLCLLAASLPNEAILGGYDQVTGKGTRTPSYYLGITASIVAVVSWSRLVRLVMQSKALLLLFAAHATGLLILLVLIAGGDGHWVRHNGVDRQFKVIYLAALALTLVGDRIWRRRLLLSYLVGWAIFVGLTHFLVLTGRANVFMHYGGAARASVMGMNSNAQSVFTASGTLLVFVEAARSTSLRGLALCGVAFFAGLAASMSGNSRTAMASLVGALVFVMARTLFRGTGTTGSSRVRVALVVGVLAAVGLWLVNEFGVLQDEVTAMSRRVDTALEGSDRGERDILAAKTWSIFLKNPGGVGFGRTWEMLHLDPHNGYLKVLAECGVFGAAFFLGGALVVFKNVARWMKYPEEIGPAACLLFFAISAITSQALMEATPWLFIAFFALPPRRGADGEPQPLSLRKSTTPLLRSSG